MSSKKNYVLASHITGVYDVNRRQTLKDDDFSLVQTWAESLKRLEINGVLFHNNFSDSTIDKYQNPYLQFEKITYQKKYNPNVSRYFFYKDFINHNKECIQSVYFTDVNDVELVKNPFIEDHFIEHSSSLFCGDEPIALCNEWMINHSAHFRKNIPDFASFENKFKHASLLNCGVIGGRVDVIATFLDKICEVHENYNQNNTTAYTGDMGAFNYVIRSYFNSRIIHGYPVNTVFKKYEYLRKDCWFRHK